MDAPEYLQRQFLAVRRLTDAATQELTDEQLNWMPPGTVNPIKTAWLHLIGAEDRYIQWMIKGGVTVWETEGWAIRLGVPVAPGRVGGWEESRAVMLTIGPVADYQHAVRAATASYLGQLTGQELAREVDSPFGKRPVADLLAQLVAHTVGHAGEIAALRGVQGVQGLPF